MSHARLADMLQINLWFLAKEIEYIDAIELLQSVLGMSPKEAEILVSFWQKEL